MNPYLVHADGRRVCIGDKVTNFRGESAIVVSVELPHSPASTGRVYAQMDGRSRHPQAFFPSVFELTWVDRTDQS